MAIPTSGGKLEPGEALTFVLQTPKLDLNIYLVQPLNTRCNQVILLGNNASAEDQTMLCPMFQTKLGVRQGSADSFVFCLVFFFFSSKIHKILPASLSISLKTITRPAIRNIRNKNQSYKSALL
ncbi:hypothetical protein CDL12_15704 [Handroanthus impetiginosus]|uniref:Uncharacterized protein n=1 Tax=Handroanthus impetiginosus TaxID=429701 RepID=A0A2G9H2F3_9LAMI|nr:hypothetical protein CDL12_15704 [Handroanthus impetiginosus]